MVGRITVPVVCRLLVLVCRLPLIVLMLFCGRKDLESKSEFQGSTPSGSTSGFDFTNRRQVLVGACYGKSGTESVPPEPLLGLATGTCSKIQALHGAWSQHVEWSFGTALLVSRAGTRASRFLQRLGPASRL
jgi:hypothetical protein